MRELDCRTILTALKESLMRANHRIGPDILGSLEMSMAKEESALGRSVLAQLVENDRIAAEEFVPICQDTGMVVAFVELGQDVHIVGGGLRQTIDEAVRQAYREASFRNSVVEDPIFHRKNTGDNTPAVVYVDLVPGESLSIDLMAKGFGSENMSAIRMLTPAEGVEGVRRFVLETVEKAGPNPCPPIIVGIGLGGTFEKAAVLAKRALLRKIGSVNADEAYAGLERQLLSQINDLGIGPAGLGGTTTALAVHIEHYPTHIAGMPAAVNICCHASRHARVVL